MADLLKTIKRIYCAHITGTHHILPTRADPPELVRCVAMTHMTLSPELARKMQMWSPTSTHVVLPLAATRLSGTIKAAFEGRGVKIIAGITRKQQFLDGPPRAFEALI